MIKTIITKLHKLKEKDTGFSIFGSNSHKYILNPVLSENEIVAFEQAYKIKLPTEYRQFLLQMGNGGAGPFYGLYSLDNEENSKDNLPNDFPFTQNNPLKIIDEMDNLSADADDDEIDAFWDNVNNRATSGIIVLAHEGCGMFSVLVVKGKEYGNIWYFDLANDAGVFPLTGNTGNPMGFYEWYNIWLDSSLEDLESGKNNLQSYADFIQEAE